MFLGIILPYMHDDWEWGSVVGLNRLATFFIGFNGRWAGNIAVILLTRSLGLRAILYSATMVLTVYLTCKTSNRSDFLAFGSSSILLLCMSHEMFSQVIAWTSGFANYTLSMPFMLLVVLVVKNKLYSKEKARYSVTKTIAICITCFVGLFFVEHLSFFLLCLTALALISFMIRNKKIDPLFLILMLCSVIGITLMFSNPAYSEALLNENNYQRVSLTKDFRYMFLNAIDTGIYIVSNLFVKQAVLSVLLCALSIILLWKTKPRYFQNMIVILSFYVFYSLIRNRVPFLAIDTYTASVIESIIGVTAILCIVYSVFHTEGLKQVGMFYVLSICAISVPLLFVSPVSTRNLYAPYLFMMMLTLEILFYLLNIQQMKNFKVLNRFVMLTGICCMLFYSAIFTTVSYSDHNRILSHQALINGSDRTLVIHNLPFENYLFHSTPMDERYMTRYKMFYGLPEDSEIIFIQGEFVDPVEQIKNRIRSEFSHYNYIAPD